MSTEFMRPTQNKRDETTYGFFKDETFESENTTYKELDNNTFHEFCVNNARYFGGVRRNYNDLKHVIRQAIGYIVVKNHTGDKVFVYKRSKGSDQKLEGNFSIGLGGHIETPDILLIEDTGIIDVAATILESSIRELDEELNGYFDADDVIQCDSNIVGVIIETNKDNVDYIGNDHIGFVVVVTMPEDVGDLEIAEEKYETVGWTSIDQLKSLDQNLFEPWSRLVIEQL